MKLRCNPGVFLAHLRELADSARTKSGGITRLAWSKEDLAAKSLIASWVADSRILMKTDAVGNLIGELPGSEAGLHPLVIGSHLDTVVEGGELDGAFGALAGFEVLRLMAEEKHLTRHPIRVVAWANEEGVVAPPFTGSRAASGQPIDMDSVGPDGKRLAERISEAGGDPLAVAGVAMNEIQGYLELHIEQGPVLDRVGAPIGVVTGISGSRRGWIHFSGSSNHAGTTPMDMRSDALLAAAHTVVALRELGLNQLVDVATAGGLEVKPGLTNVIAGEASVSFDLRGMDDVGLGVSVERLSVEVQRIALMTETKATLSVVSSTHPTPTDPLFRSAVAEAAQRFGLRSVEMPSGAGHDAQSIARIAPMGMIFVPSIDGISHNRDEATNPDDLVAGVDVLLATLMLLDERM